MANSVTNCNESQKANELADTQSKSTNHSPVIKSVQFPNGIDHTATDTGDTMEIDDRDETEEVDYESPETLAIRSMFSQLIDVFTHQVDQLASEFYQEGLLEISEYSIIIECTGKSCSKRAIELLQAAMSKIRVAKSNFDTFVRVLKGHQTFSEIVDIMKKRYKKLVQEDSNSSSTEDSELPQPSSNISVGAEELQLEIGEIEKRLENVRKGVGKRKGRKEKELRLTRQEVTQLKQTLDETEKQLAISKFQNDFFQEQLRKAQAQIAQLTREVVELKQQRPSCGLKCEHYAKCELLQKENEKLEDLRVEHVAKIANLNAQIAYLLEGSQCQVSPL